MKSISQKDIKLLWGRAASRCSVCREELSQDKKTSSGSLLIGEQAHIVGEKEGSARSHSVLTASERNSYHNLILLCPNHHTEVDKNEEDWPVEKLHMFKSEHELWVQSTLSEIRDSKSLAQDLIYTNIIDSTVEYCELQTWSVWTSWALAPCPRWDITTFDKIGEFRRFVLRAIWPGKYPDLERAIQTLAIAVYDAREKFSEHIERRDETYWSVPFYKTQLFTEDEYRRRLRLYRTWIDQCHGAVFEATKAANWFADEVRESINPMFFATEGKFVVDRSQGFDDHTYLLEYDEEDRGLLPQVLLDRVRERDQES